MGQALDSIPSSKVLEGEIEVGNDAMTLLQSREEERSLILKVSSLRALELPPPPSECLEDEEQVARVKRALGLKDFYEDDMEKATDYDQTDQLLADVLYALHHLNLPTTTLSDNGVQIETPDGGSEGKGGTSAGDCTGSRISYSSLGDSNWVCPFSKQELHDTLKEVFDVDGGTIDTVLQNIRRRECPEVILHLHIIEAKDLRPKTSKGTAHAFCLVKVSDSEDLYKTEIKNNTTVPFWDCPFLIKIVDHHTAKITIEVWHEPQESSIEQFAAMKEEISRVVLGSNEFKNLLGTVTIPIENIKNKLSDGWYNLVKKEEMKTHSLRESFRINKKRGSLHLSMKSSIKSQVTLLGFHWYDALLNRILQHRLGFLCTSGDFARDGFRTSTRSSRSSMGRVGNHNSMNSASSASTSSGVFGSSFESESGSTSTPVAPWTGTISSIDAFILCQYGALLNMTPPRVALSWWKITSKLTIVDQSYLGDLLKTLHDYIDQKEYSEEDLMEAKSSLRLWVVCQQDKLRQLHAYFPIYSRVISYHQLTHTLRNLKYIDEMNRHLCDLNLSPEKITFSKLVIDAVTEFTKIWWEKTLQNCDPTSQEANEEQQLEAVVFVTSEVLQFLRDVCNFYEAIFKNEADIAYFKLSYILLTSELAARIRPLLHKMYDAPEKRDKGQGQRSNGLLSQDGMQTMEDKGTVWQLYKKLENISVEMGQKLPEDVRKQSAIADYHSWFLKVIRRWQKQILSRAKNIVLAEVQKDDFEDFNPKLMYTSGSANGVSYIFQIVKTQWLKFDWPYDVDGDVITSSLLDNLCSLGKYYTKLVINKLKSKTQDTISQDSSFFPVKVCVALNNVEYLRQEIKGLPTLFKLQESDDESTRKTTIINKTLKTMESQLLSYIKSSVEKIKPNLREAVVLSCDRCSELPLLSDSLDDDLCRLKRYLSDANLRRVLLHIWNVLVHLFADVVKDNADKRKAEYFMGVHKILDRTWHFFTPSDRSGLDPQIAHIPEYQSLKNNLSNLKMGTDFLIAKYYQERYDEQQKKHEEMKKQDAMAVPELIVHVYFTTMGKLKVEVIMARNISECGAIPSPRNPFGARSVSVKQPDSFVQIKMVPSEWFPDMIKKTKTHKKNTSPVFEEAFQFNISSTDHSAKVGLLLFTIKTTQFLQSGFIGEAILPLDTIPCVELSNASSVANVFLHVNKPKGENEYQSLQALKFRTWDRKASSFTKELKDLTRRKGSFS